MRAVFGVPALAEKLRCFDAALDDRLLEVLKLELLGEQPVPLAPGRAPRLAAAGADDLLFVLTAPTDAADAIRVPRARLERLRERRDELAGAIRKLSAGPYVDIGRVVIAGTAEIAELPG